MTNKEFLLTLPDKECADLMDWLIREYARCYTVSITAIENWLGDTYNHEKYMLDRFGILPEEKYNDTRRD